MKTCFVISPIGDREGGIRRAADDFMEYIVDPCIKGLGFDPAQRSDHLPEPGSITSQIIKLLIEADLVIADLTGANSNVYYELSLRHAIGKPAIHMALENTKLSFDIADNRTIFYTMHARHVEQVKADLGKQIIHVQDSNYKARNPIVDAVGLIKLEGSAEPAQRLMATVLQAMETIQRDMLWLKNDVSQLRSQASHNLYGGLSGVGIGGIPGAGIGGFPLAGIGGIPGAGIGGMSGAGTINLNSLGGSRNELADPPLTLRDPGKKQEK